MRPAPAGGLKRPTALRLSDPSAERVHRELSDDIEALQQLPASAIRIVHGIVLLDATPTYVPHGLGRAPVFIVPSVPRGPPSSGGYFSETRGMTDRAKTIVITATGFGGTITVDLLVM